MEIRKLIILAVGALLILTGCDATPTANPSSAPIPSQRSSAQGEVNFSSKPTSSAKYIAGSAMGPAINVPFPKSPIAVQGFSEKSAKAFTLHYFDLINYAIETNDSEELKRLSSRKCNVCNKSIIGEAEASKKSNRWQVGGMHHPVVVDSYISSKNVAIVTVEYTADATTVYSKPNVIHEQLDKLNKTRIAVDLEYNKEWKVYKIIGAE